MRARNDDRWPVACGTDVPVRIPGLQFSARRVLGHPHTRGIAGFQDVAPLGRGRWGLALGDMYRLAGGDGRIAAAQIDIARVVTRAVAKVDFTPSVVLAGINRALLAGESAQAQCALAAAYVTIWPSLVGAWARICVAGPQTAFLRRSSGRTAAIGRPGTALGVRSDPWLSDSRLLLRAGDILTLVTATVTEGLGGPNNLCEILADAASAARATGEIARAFNDAGGTQVGGDGMVLAVRVPGNRRDHGLHSAGWPGRAPYDGPAWPDPNPGHTRAPRGRTRYPF